MDQQIKEFDIADLVLWTENPRDPIDPSATDQDIIDRAIANRGSKWTLSKLAKDMGPHYDLSELPTVVFHGSRPVVYDGNRRIILGKLKHGLATNPTLHSNEIPTIPRIISCNVCREEIAIRNVFRKHADTGSWQPLERDMFIHRFMRKEKSAFLALEDETGLISANPHLNQRFVKEELLSPEILLKLGFSIVNGALHSSHTPSEAKEIFLDISDKVKSKKITTRKNRGKLLEVLEPSTLQRVDLHRKKALAPTDLSFLPSPSPAPKRRTKRRNAKKLEFFGGHLYLKSGLVSDLYRDVVDLHQFYLKEKSRLSTTFPNLIRMALRLLCDTAAMDKSTELKIYLTNHFDAAKSQLSQDQKTTLSNHNVRRESITQLLHTGAHTYSSSSSFDQTIALSLVVGAILTISHGRNQ